jgi:hypothetical protein
MHKSEIIYNAMFPSPDNSKFQEYFALFVGFAPTVAKRLIYSGFIITIKCSNSISSKYWHFPFQLLKFKVHDQIWISIFIFWTVPYIQIWW